MFGHTTSGRGSLTLLLFSGTASNIIAKLLYSVSAPGLDGDELKPFAKPWFSTLLMFLGMALCLPCSWLFEKFTQFSFSNTDSRSSSSARGDEETPLLLSPQDDQQDRDRDEEEGEEEESALAISGKGAWRQRYGAIIFPTLFDLVASALLSVGLLFITASLYQMMRGTEIIFTAILSILLLHRHLNTQNMTGLLLCTLGLVLVGYSGLLSSREPQQHGGGGDSIIFSSPKYLSIDPFSSTPSSSSPTGQQALLGMMLIVVAEAVQALQIVAEDYLMSAAAASQLPPIDVVGYEGIFGLVIMSLVVLPLLQISPFGTEGSGLREDSLESIHMLMHSRPLALLASIYVVGMAAYNFSGMMVTDSLGALSRTVAETARTLLVWSLNLLLYYKMSSSSTSSSGKAEERGGVIGEPWTNYSWLQAVGFVVLVGGTAIYALGEERNAEEMREKLERKARERWALLRASVPRLLELARLGEEEGGLTVAERQSAPAKPLRIAGPARIRVALRALQAGARLRRKRGAAARQRERQPGD